MPDLSEKFCRKPFEHFEAHPNGAVSLCCYTWLPYHAGKISPKHSISDVFNSNIVQDIRESIHDGSFKYCNHNLCPHIQNGDLPNKDDVEGPRMRRIIDEKLTTGLTPDFYNLCYDESCNLRCPSCRKNQINYNSGDGYEMRKRVQNRIIKDLFETYHERNSTVNITGSGDPFGSKLFRELLFSIDGKNFPRLNINLQTNGVMFTPKYWDKMYKIHKNINTVVVSFDAGIESTYDKIRVGGDWKRLHENMKFISKLRSEKLINELRIDYVVQDNNYREMPLAIEYGKQYGVDTVYFSMVVNWGTWTDQQFMQKAVYGGHHPHNSDFLHVLSNPIFDDPIVDLGNLTQFRTNYAHE